MEPLKNIFNKKLIKIIALEISKYDQAFDEKSFIVESSKHLEILEMKDRVRHISCCLSKYLSKNYTDNTKTLINCLAPRISANKGAIVYSETEGLKGFAVWPFAQYIEDNGLNDLQTSLMALKEITKRFTSEFAIRVFIQKYNKKVYKVLTKWLKDKNPHVRRLVSEGTRPLLPWGNKVEWITSNLIENIPLLEELATDSSEYVRRSVANHLNDISRLDDELFFNTLKKIQVDTPESIWIQRHASRTLLKKGHPQALRLHGYSSKIKLEVNLKLAKKNIIEGETLKIDLKVQCLNKSKKNILVDYIIYYKKKNSELSPKVFRLRDTTIEGEINISKEISMKKVTTRKHYSGQHFIEIQINGVRYKKTAFKLLCK